MGRPVKKDILTEGGADLNLPDQKIVRHGEDGKDIQVMWSLMSDVHPRCSQRFIMCRYKTIILGSL